MDLKAVLCAHGPRLRNIVEKAEEFKFQVLVSEAVEGSTKLRHYDFRTDAEYFYPASAIKLCAAVSALQLLPASTSQLPPVPLQLCSPLSLLPLRPGDEEASTDPTNFNGGTITVAHCLRKMMLVSDNGSFNTLFELIGHRRLNQSMWHLGLSSTALQHRLSLPLPLPANKLCRPLQVDPAFLGHVASSQAVEKQARQAMKEGMEGKEGGSTGSYCVPPKRSMLALPPPPSSLSGLHIGTAYIDAHGNKVDAPLDFSDKNRMSLRDLHCLLILLFRPDIWENLRREQGHSAARLGVQEGYLRVLQDAMAAYPRESHSPCYSAASFPDDYCKFFLPGLCRVRPKAALRVFNKIGQAYGFTIDNAYILDVETGRELFVSMVLYTNANGILNDDRYEYDLAYAAAADVAEAVSRSLWSAMEPMRSSSFALLDPYHEARKEKEREAHEEEARGGEGAQTRESDQEDGAAANVPNSEEGTEGEGALLDCYSYFLDQ